MRVLAFLLLATAACAQTTFPAWVFQKKTSASSASVPVVISGQNNKVFGLDGSGNLALLTNGSGSSTLVGLGDVAITGIANEDLLRYDTNESKWLNISSETLLGAPVIALRDLADGAGALTNDGAGVLSWVSYQPLDSDLTSIAALATHSYGRGVLQITSSGNMKTYLGLLSSPGGDGANDDGKYATFANGGSLAASGFYVFNGTGDTTLLGTLSDANHAINLPDGDGTLLLANGSGASLTALNASNIASGTLSVSHGGTGSTSLTANNVLLGNGTSALQAVAPGTSGNVLTSNGTTWVSSAAAGAGHTIKEEGSGLTARAGLNFVGGGVTAADDAGNNETDVTVTRTGVYRTIYLAAAAGIPRTTNGCGVGSYESSTNKINYDTLEFDASTDEKAQWLLKMPDEWNGGTIKAKVAWTAASSSGNTYWELRAGALTDDDAIDTALGTAATTNDTLTATGDLDETAATGACTVGNSPAAGKYVVFELSRDADNGSDTLAADALVIGVTIQYQESSTEPSSW